jgi:MoaA/NifB/PqqE/SkfB family radical SAM enzyme
MIKKPVRYAQQLAYRLRQAGPRKTLNIVAAELERRLRRTTLRSRPYFYYVDPCDACNLRCPLCATGNGSKHVRGMLSLDEYKAIFAKIAPYAVEVGLYSWGEPLLNKAIFDMIRHTADHGIRPILSSNLSLRIPNLGERLVAAGTGKLIVSLDGTTAESYERYRVRGDFELVLANMREIVAARRRMGSKTPIVEWQFVVFKHNEHERAVACAMARELGVELRFAAPFLPPERWPERRRRAAGARGRLDAGRPAVLGHEPGHAAPARLSLPGRLLLLLSLDVCDP